MEKIEEEPEDIHHSNMNTFHSGADGELREIVEVDRATQLQNEISIKKEAEPIKVDYVRD